MNLDELARSVSTRLGKPIKQKYERIENVCNVTFKHATKEVNLACEVVSQERDQREGLQKYSSLNNDFGMLFKFPQAKRASFHMGSVSFPIDIIFVNDNDVVSGIVHNVQPGTKGSWSANRTACVVEANGGFCKLNGIIIGDKVIVGISKMAQETYNPPRLDDHTRGLSVNNNTPDRFKNKDLVDEQVASQPFDVEYRKELEGNDPIGNHDNQDVSATRPGPS